MGVAAVVIHITPGTPRFGLWCPACLLPSGYEVPMHTLTRSGVGTLGVIRRCHDCDEPLLNEPNTTGDA